MKVIMGQPTTNSFCCSSLGWESNKHVYPSHDSEEISKHHFASLSHERYAGMTQWQKWYINFWDERESRFTGISSSPPFHDKLSLLGKKYSSNSFNIHLDNPIEPEAPPSPTDDVDQLADDLSEIQLSDLIGNYANCLKTIILSHPGIF